MYVIVSVNNSLAIFIIRTVGFGSFILKIDIFVVQRANFGTCRISPTLPDIGHLVIILDLGKDFLQI